MNRVPEYAVEYTKCERVRFVLVGATLGALIVAASQVWLFPWLKDFAATAHCRTVLGLPGQSALFYGIFVGLPLLAATVLAATVGRRGLKIVRQGQVPPAGEKVLRPTIIRRGEQARLIGYAHLLVVLAAVVLALWGFVQAGKLIESVRSVPNNCAANYSSKPTPLRGAA